MSIWNNDEARRFFIDNGYPEQFNDGLKAYLEDKLSLVGQGFALNDLLRIYIGLYGTDFILTTLNNLLLEDNTNFLLEDSSFLLLEA